MYTIEQLSTEQFVDTFSVRWCEAGLNNTFSFINPWGEKCPSLLIFFFLSLHIQNSYIIPFSAVKHSDFCYMDSFLFFFFFSLSLLYRHRTLWGGYWL